MEESFCILSYYLERIKSFKTNKRNDFMRISFRVSHYKRSKAFMIKLTKIRIWENSTTNLFQIS